MGMDDREGVIWMDGAYVAWRDAKVHVLTHTLHYGLGVFEGLRAYSTDKGTAIFRLKEHTDRLYRSAHIVGMRIPYEKDALNEVQQEIVRKNKLNSAYIRPVVYYGAEGLGLHADNLS
ncbi:MAG TPA: aminotransferase class IV, partial [Gammaproteobacteria bacterium]|nr:aminotransferase class IV [Gammaproteobacteria bacterium]